MRLAGAAGVGDARAAGARCSRSRLARLSRSPRAISSCASVGARPRPFRSNRASSRRTARLLTWTPRWLRGDVLEVVRLVEHQPPVRRQHRRLLPVVLGLPDREVGREQVVVHHHHVGLRRPAPGPEQEAAVEVAALEPGAEVRLRAHLVPHLAATA